MPRLPRLKYENAIYHVATRGDGRRRLLHDDPSPPVAMIRPNGSRQKDTVW
ncbi:hypothetical protein [Rhodopirellula sp. P2]|uniref:hypothetical protein n=1 Tax=Rhodopirellula sp. P2 TaxID=2127060 RepID=UPI0023674B62|nr:hypothetical protein [Rhodopirellula sp. P2]WDQ18075.1 hypothetical protein PSR62_05855 [Rhodopirellula sp. P2]